MIKNKEELYKEIKKNVEKTEVVDIHTHLFPESFGELCLYGIDDILNYHYLIAEFFLCSDMKYSEFYKLKQKERSEKIWEELFVNRTFLSEASNGVLTILERMGIKFSKDLNKIRTQFKNKISKDKKLYFSEIFKLAGVKKVIMTNDIFSQKEMNFMKEVLDDSKYGTSIRLDSVFKLKNSFSINAFNKKFSLSKKIKILKYIEYCVQKMAPAYLAISVGEDFSKFSKEFKYIEKEILPICRNYEIPIALMVGVRRGVNAKIKDAGDSVGKIDMTSIEELAKKNEDINFLVTALSRENQYELTVTARKFRNIKVFGTWWFLNNDIFIDEITKMRINLLGIGNFIPQHSDARVFEQLVYKWEHSRKIMTDVLYEKFLYLLRKGYSIDKDKIEKTTDLFFNNSSNKILKI